MPPLAPFRLLFALAVFVALPTTGAAAGAGVSASCPAIAVPPERLSTRSKYTASDKSKSTVDPELLAERKRQLAPLTKSLKQVSALAFSASATDASEAARCLFETLESFAKAPALTRMESTDALLSRDRWIAEIALAYLAARRTRRPRAEEAEAISQWLSGIGHDIERAYETRVGPHSRRNNHRAWAGLAATASGLASGDKELVAWGRESFSVLACQVDQEGYLPEELRRGSRALSYHVYALRPLAAEDRLLRSEAAAGSAPAGQTRCTDGYRRLLKQVCRSLADPSAVAKRTGIRQLPIGSDSAFPPPLRLAAIGLGNCAPAGMR